MKLPKSSEELQQFKDTLFELSVRLISVPAHQIGDEIDRALDLIAAVWDFDIVLFSELMDSEKGLPLAHSYMAPGITLPLLLNAREEIPWLMKKITRGETVVLSRLPNDLPKAASADRGFCIKAGIKSCLTLPFTSEESGRGILLALSLKNERS
jgi:hypothetical protein